MANDEGGASRIRRGLNGPEGEERRMFGGLAFLIDGRMCCGVGGDVSTAIRRRLGVKVKHVVHQAALCSRVSGG